jgi:hypothetical protein
LQYDVITFVTAARGVAALRHALGNLPSSFAAPIVCLAQCGARALEELRAATRLRVQWAEPGVPLEKGTVYLNPPMAGLVWRPDGTLSVTAVSLDSTAHSPVDHFLASTAAVHGAAAACFVLSGLESDGVKGALDLRRVGGTVLVLDRATARHWGLAEPIVRAGGADRVLTLTDAVEALRACFTGRDLLRCAEIQIELGRLLETACAVSGTRMGHITRRLDGRDALKVLVHRGLGAHFLERFDTIPITPETAVGRACVERRRIVVSDVLCEPEYAPRRQDALLCGYRAAHATPIPPGARHVVEGVLTTLFVHTHEVTPYEARDIDRVAEEAARWVSTLGRDGARA